MAVKTKLIQTQFLSEDQQRQADSAARQFGPRLCGEYMKVLRMSEMLPLDHPQTELTARALVHSLNEAFELYKEDSFSIQLSEKNIFLNGDLIRFDESQYQRSVFLRALFSGLSVNVIQMNKGIAYGEILAMLHAVDSVKHKKVLGLSAFSQPNLHLSLSPQTDLDVQVQLDEKRELVELYAALLIKCAMYFHQLARVKSPSAKHVKRLIQKVTDKLDEHRHIFVGLITLRLVRGQTFIHAVNTALYAMLIAHQISLDRSDIVRVGMTALTQDIHRMRNPMNDQAQIELGQDSHFQTNMTSVTMLSEMGAKDVLSALRLVTSYERGFPFSKPIPDEWYARELTPHLLSRIIEIANHYDVLTTGVGGEKAVASDKALQAIMGSMGRHYDPELTKLFINVMGIYPVGAMVLLSTNERAVVIRSPALIENKSVAHRPTVRLLDQSERILNLGADEHRSIRIVEIIDDAELDQHPGAMFLF